MIVALDTSALGKLLVEEPESGSLRDHLRDQASAGDTFCASSIAVTELQRMTVRLDLAVEAYHRVVAPFTIIRLTEGVLQLAGHLPHRHLRTLDAIHIASALTVEARSLLTYDRRQSDAARLEGLLVTGPGPG